MSAPAESVVREKPIALWITGVGLLLVVSLMAWALSAAASFGGWPAYEQWASDLASAPNWLRWVVGDTNEAQFYKSALAGVGMTLGALLAWSLLRGRSRLAGFPVVYGSGLIGWILAASWISLLLANLGWQWTISAETPWQPTFVTFVSVPAAVILIYGGSWAKVATAAVLGAALTTPVSIAVVNYVCVPLGLPSVVGNVTGMWVGGLVAFAVCRLLPWMTRPEPAPDTPDESTAEPSSESSDQAQVQTPSWVVRRVLADFTEPQFYGNEWASLGLIAGVALEFLLNPASPVYGSGLLPAVLVSQFGAATLGVLVFRKQWAVKGWYPTFIPIVSVAPAIVLALGGTPIAIVLGAVLGGLIAPPMGAWLAQVLPEDFHPFIAYVFTMMVTCAVLVPLVGVIPGL